LSNLIAEEIDAQQFLDDQCCLRDLIEALIDDVPGVIVVDHFEDIFLSCTKEERDAFANNLFSLIQPNDSGHTVILTMNSDHLGKTDLLELFHERLHKGIVFVKYTTDEFREAIEQPANLIGLKFDDGVVDRLILDVQGDPSALSLLQFTLRQLWNHREGNRISWDKYNLIGGGRLAIERAAESAYQELSESDKPNVRGVFLTLIKPAAGQQTWMCDIERDEICPQHDDRAAVDRVIDHFLEAGLLTTRSTTNSDVISVAHDALASHWPRLMDWLAEERFEQRRRMRLTEIARSWDSRNRDPEVLWRGSQLDDTSKYTDLSQLELEFVARSREAVERAEQEKVAAAKKETQQAKTLATEQRKRADSERKNRIRTLMFLHLLGIGFVVLAAMAAWTWAEKRSADRSAKDADKSKIEAQQHAEDADASRYQANRNQLKLTVSRGNAFQESGDHPGAALWFNHALDLMKENKDPDRQFTEKESINLQRRILTGLRQQPILCEHWLGKDAAFTPDGSSIIVGLTSGEEPGTGGIRVHSVRNGQQSSPRFEIDDDSILLTEVDVKGQWVAVARESSVHLYDVATGKRKCTLFDDPTKIVRIICFSQMGNRFAIGLNDQNDSYGQVQVWKFPESNQGQEFVPQVISADLQGRVAQISFSQNGVLMAAAIKSQKESNESKIQQPNDSTQSDSAPLYGSDGDWIRKDWNPKSPPTGRSSLFERGDRALVWNLDQCAGEKNSDPLSISMFHRFEINDLEFNPRIEETDHATLYRLATVSGSQADRAGELQFWTIPIPLAPEPATESDEPTENLTRDQELLQNNLLALRHPPDMTIAHSVGLRCIAYSPTGRTLVTGDVGGLALLKDATTGTRLATLHHGSSVNEVVFSPDGRHVATGSRDRTARIWDVSTGELAFQPLWHAAGVGRLKFGPHGRNLITLSGGKSIRMWRLKDQNLPEKLLRTAGEVQQVKSSRSGKSLIIVSMRFDEELSACSIWQRGFNDDHPISLKSAATEAERENGLRSRIIDAALSGNGEHAVTVDRSGRIRRWSRVDGVWQDLTPETPPLGMPQERPERVGQIAISSDGKRVAVVRSNAKTQTSKIHVSGPSGEELLNFRVRVQKRPAAADDDKQSCHDDEILSLTFDDTATRIATTGKDDHAFVWTLNSDASDLSRTIGPLNHAADVVHAEFDREGKYLVTSGMDQNVLVWDIEQKSDLPEAATVLRHASFVSHASFSSDGNFLVTACNDGRARVWYLNFNSNGEMRNQLVSVLEHGGSLDRVGFSDDGDYVTTIGFYLPDVIPPQDANVTRPRRRLSVRSWDISHDAESASQLEILTRLASARSYNKNLNQIEFLTPQHFREDWESRPKVHAPSVDAPEPLVQWHARIAAESELTNRWYAAKWHLSRLIDRNPGSADLFRRRAIASAELGSYVSAGEDSDRADRLGHHDNHLLRTLALAVLATKPQGETSDKWKRICARILTHHENAILRSNAVATEREKLMEANLGVWTCVVDPSLPPSEYQRAVAIAERLVEFEENRHGTSPYLDRFSNTLGAAYYRAGQYKNALELLSKSEKQYEDLQQEQEEFSAYRFNGKIWNWIFLAMTHRAMQNTESAKKYVELATKVYENRSLRPRWFSDSLAFQQPTWDQRITLRILMNEIQSEIEPGEINPPPLDVSASLDQN
jgi:WD40 repeat protein/tetratricopeptide (TPR) repeat protein